MTTANDLITRAFRRARIKGVDQIPDATESADALTVLNQMLDQMWNERLSVYHILQETFTLSAGNASRTIGATGDFVTTRPLRIEDGCFVRRNSYDYQVAVLRDRALYDQIGLKSVQGIPRYVFYDATEPNGTLYFWPTPDAADSVYLNSLARLQGTLTLVTTLTLPPGYDKLLTDGLAIDLCPEYGIEPTPGLIRSFSQSKRVIKRINAPSPVMGYDAAVLPRTRVFDINMGY